MRRSVVSLALTLVGVACACAAAPKSYQVGASSVNVDLPSGWRIDRAGGADLAKRLSSTGCILFIPRGKTASVGHLCEFDDVAKLEGVGVVRLDSLPEHARSDVSPATEMVSLSGSSVRPLEAVAGTARMAGERDCDESNGTSYRATATCYVSVQFTAAGGVLFSEVVLADHVKKRVLVSTEQIQRLMSGVSVAK
jgi:hypothetical protein